MADHRFESGRHLVGKTVHKKFKGFGLFSGKVVSFNSVRGFYKIRYEDGDGEEMIFDELKKILTPEKNDGSKRENEEPPQRGRRGRKKKRRSNEDHEDRNSGALVLRNSDNEVLTNPGDEALRKSGADLLRNSGNEVLGNPGDETLKHSGAVVLGNSGDDVLGNPGEEVLGNSGEQILRIKGKKRGRKKKSESRLLASGPVRRSSRQAAVVAAKETEEVSGEEVRVRVRRRRRSVQVEKLRLPPSSGDLCVPEESVPGLLNVYNTLRSFSKLLFLSPFTLDDFVAALVCTKANSLVDSVHLALLQALRRHLEFIAPDEGPAGATAVKCLKQLDWNFLDMITWPVYLVQYLASHGFGKLSGQKVSYLRLCNSEYYMTSVSLKISFLEFLCNEVMESEEISAEISIRLKFEGVEEADEMENLVDCPASAVEKKSRRGRRGRRRIYSRNCKQSAILDCVKSDGQESLILSQIADDKLSYAQIIEKFQGNSSCIQNYEIRSDANDVENRNSDECCLCSMDGALICCDGCPAAYHSRCVGVSEDSLPEGNWYCPECLVKKGPKGLSALTGLQGAEFLGIDSHGRVYFSICGYLLVSDSATDPDATYKYYNRNDSMNILEILDPSTPLYDIIHNAVEKSSDMLNTYNHGPKDKISKMEPLCLNKADNLSQKCDSKELSISQSFVQKEQEKTSVIPFVTSQENAPVQSSYVLEGEGVQGFNTVVHKQDFEMMVIDEHNNASQVTSSQSSLEKMSLTDDTHVFKNSYEQQLVDSSGPRYVEHTKNIPTQDKPLTEVDAGSAVFQVEQQPEQSDICTASVPGHMNLIANCTSDQVAEQSDICTASVPGQIYLIANFTSDQVAFKLNTYVNQYILGDMAASAAANLAVNAAENKRTTSLQGSSRRSAPETIKEQMKVFSKAAVQFFWPGFSNKLVDVQKEKCGWCLNCKSSTSSLKDCLLHIASENAMAGASGRAGGVCPTKIGDVHFPELVAYVLYMEDQLHCLLDGPWVNPSYRGCWRKYVEQASSISEIKNSLLELELNLKSVTLSADWFKPVDDAFTGFYVDDASIISEPVLTPKRGRPRKNSISVPVLTSQQGFPIKNSTSVPVLTQKQGFPIKNRTSVPVLTQKQGFPIKNNTPVPLLTPKRGRPRKNTTSEPVLTPKQGLPTKTSTSPPVITPKRGRPRKNSTPEPALTPKQGFPITNSTSTPVLTPKRGRPRKNSTSEPVLTPEQGLPRKNSTSEPVLTPEQGLPRKNSTSEPILTPKRGRPRKNSTSEPVLTSKQGCHRKNSTSEPVLTLKRGCSTKNSVSAKISSPLLEARPFGVNWWRGGRLSGQLLCQNFLPRIIAQRSGRQAGFRKIAGIFYSEGAEMPRRSKQYAWRAAVEMAKTVSQLALQIRILDAFIRWDDLVNTEDFPQSKWIEEKRSAGFKKAVIRAKNSKKGLVKYLVDFGKQKDIPTCVVKHGIKFEDDEDGRKKFWVGDNYVPLYLLKKFQEKARACSKKDIMQFHLLPIKSSKSLNSDVFSFLLAKTGLEKSSCAHCRRDIVIWKAVQCGICKGFFHRKCILNSLIVDVSEFQFTCSKCHNIRLLETDHKLQKLDSETKGVLSRKRHRLVEDLEQKEMPSPSGKRKKCKRRKSLGEDVEEQKQGTEMKDICSLAEKPKENVMCSLGGKQKNYKRHQSNAEQKHASVFCMLAEQEKNEMSLSGGKQKKYRNEQMHNENVAKENHGSATKRPYRKVKDAVRLDGLLWNNNGNYELGNEFRQSKLLLPCHSIMDVSEGPKCYICRREYNPQLVYVGCQSCKEWFHGDAFRLTMENSIHLIGFKCHKCRKRSKPSCPYSDMTQCTKESVSGIGAANGEMPDGAENKELLDIIYSRSCFVINEESPAMLDSGGVLAVTEMDFKSEYIPNEDEEKIFKSAFIPFYQDPIPSEVNFDSSHNNHLQDEMLSCLPDRKDNGLRETSIISEMKNGIIIQSDPNIQTPSLLSYTELLASEDDKVENLFDLFQDGVHNWSTNVLPADMAVNMSQLHGAVQSPNQSDKIESHQANSFSLENFINQPYGKGNKFILDDSKLEKCANCNSIEVPPDLQCSGCGIAIHCHCYDRAPNGLWNEYGWLCGGCQARFVQG